tara:strand:+ start:138 stop:317 length:180 start_codon:yes stop_codon:yes gene_type:complete
MCNVDKISHLFLFTVAIGGFIFAGHELLYYGGLYLTGLFTTATVAICWSGYNIWRYMIR